MNADKERQMLKIATLLFNQTQAGELVWEKSYGNSYQTILGEQTVVLSQKGPTAPLFARRPSAVLEVRGKDGEVLERVEGADDGALTNTIAALQDEPSYRYGTPVMIVVDNLYRLVAKLTQETVAAVALENLLGTLEGRKRAR